MTGVLCTVGGDFVYLSTTYSMKSNENIINHESYPDDVFNSTSKDNKCQDGE